jgi:pyridoxal phosphate enzyme (YggS family)
VDVKAGLEQVNEKMARACERAGRDAESVKLIAVSKLQPVEKLREAMAAGHRIFGENYAQELRDKSAELPGAEWHFIGALQSNKVKMLAGKVALIHTCDRVSLARELAKKGPQRVLIEVNIGREPQKAGALPDDAPALLEQIRGLVQVDGLMCIPPAEGDPRPHFRALRELGEKLKLRELSMGMSADYEVAIDEGATIVRVGTAIFGARPT